MADLTSTTGAVALAAAAVALLALGLAVWAVLALRRLRAAQRAVLGEAGEQDLVTHAAALQHSFRSLHAEVTHSATVIDARLAEAERRLDGAVTRRSLVRYDAYNEMSGQQSTTIALLDARGSGVLLSAIAHRDQARLYAKQVVEGATDLPLSPEEQEALREATEAPAAPEPRARADRA